MTALGLAARLKSRNAAIAAGVVAIALVLLVLAIPVLAAFHAQDRAISDSLYQLGLLRAEAATAPAIRAQAAEMQRRISLLPGVLRAGSTVLAQSQLQQTIEALAAAGGGSIRSTQMLPAQKQHGFETIAIESELSVPMSKLQALLYAIETHVPYLMLDNVQIGAGQSFQGGKAGQDPRLEVRWTVRAWRWRSSR